jgi:hypothetical protein
MRALVAAFALGSGLALLALAGCAEQDEPDADEITRGVMREIFDAIRVTLPATTDAARFAAPESREPIRAALDALARNTVLLEQHFRKRDAELGFLARSIERDAAEAQLAYAHGQFGRSAFVLRQIVENCVVCHTRLPDAQGSLVAQGFVDEGVLATLPAQPRATLLIATRQFDAALSALEEVLADPLTHPAVMLGPLTDYLVVSIRVQGDYERPIEVLEAFSQREDLWPSLREDVEEWIDALPALRERAGREPTVASARSLIEAGEARDEFGDGQGSLLHFIAASSVLERYIASQPSPTAELGEAFYLRGMLETRIGRNYWVTTAPFLLEEAIRIAPGEPFARDALGRLERELFAAYEGSDIEELPAAEKAHLAQLRALIEAR